MGTTRDLIAAGGGRVCFVVAIEGYDALLTDHSSLSAVTTAWSGTGWSTALAGLQIRGEIEQQIEPWEHAPSVPVLTLLVGDATGDDTFGKAVFRSKPDFETRLTDTFGPTATGGGTMTVETTTGSASAPADLYLGGRRYTYTAKTATTFTVSAAGAGAYSPFVTSTGGSVMPWHHPHSPKQNYDKAANPKVTDSTTTRVAGWLGKLVGVYMHRIADGVLDTRDEAELIFAGVIKDVQDDGLFTVLEVEDLRSRVLENVLHQRQYRARIKEGIFLVRGTYFRIRRATPTLANFSNAFTVVASGASGDDEINEGYYLLEDLFSRMNEWMAGSGALANTTASISLATTNEGIRTKLHVSYTTSNDRSVQLRSNQHSYLEFMGFDEGFENYAGEWSVGVYEEGVDELTLFSQSTPYLVKPFQAKTFGTFTMLSLDVEQTDGEWATGSSWLPTDMARFANGEDYGLLAVDNATFWARHDSDSSFSNIHRDDPFSAMTSSEEDSFLRAGKRIGDGGMEVRQCLVLAGSFTDVFVRLFASINGDGVNHPTYDAFTTGLGVPWSLLGDNFLSSCRSLEQSTISQSVCVVLDKPTRMWEVLEDQLALRFAWLVFKDEGWQFVSPPVPNATTADHDFDETNKGGVPGDVDSLATTTEVTDRHLRNIIKIEYNRDISGKFRDSLTIRDDASIGEHGERAVTIRARSTFGDLQRTGQSIEMLAAGLAARMVPVFGKPLRTYKRSLLGTKWLTVVPGDTGNFDDDRVRDPTTGTRGIQDRAVTVLANRHSYGHEGGTLFGELELLFSEEDRTFPMAPSGDFDGSTSTNTVLTLDAHAHGRSSDDADAASFADDDVVRIIEVDPADPSSADTFTDVVNGTPSGNNVTITTGFGSGGNPTRDTSKRYRIIYDNYADCTDAQQLKSFQAGTDGLIEDLIEPNQWGDGQLLIDEDEESSPTELPEYHAAELYGDGAPFSSHLVRHGQVMVNNAVNYKSAVSMPTSFQAPVSGVSDYTTIFTVPLFLGSTSFPSGKVRHLYARPRMSETAASTLDFRLTTSKDPARGDAFSAATFRNPYNQATWSTTTTDTLMEYRALVPIPSRNAPECTWLTGELKGTGTFDGFTSLHLGPAVHSVARIPGTSDEFQQATGRDSSPTSMWLFSNDGNASDRIGSNTLTATNTPDTEVWSVACCALGVSFTDNGTQSMRASANTVLDFTTGSFAVIWIGTVDTLPTGARGVMGKRTASAGYSLDLDANRNLEWTVDGTSAQTQEVSLDRHIGEPIIALGKYDATNNSQKLYVWRNGDVTASAGTTAALGTVTNSDTFSVGDYGVNSVAGSSCVYAAVLSGAAAEGLDEDDLLALGYFIYGI